MSIYIYKYFGEIIIYKVCVSKKFRFNYVYYIVLRIIKSRLKGFK